MGLVDISYSSINSVMTSWELARQVYGCTEEVGMSILFNLFRMDKSTKTVFGFTETQNIECNPMLRMGVLVHGANIVQMIDSFLALLGPDIDTLEILLAEQGERHARIGVKPSHILLLGDACRTALAEIIADEKWTTKMDEAWKELFGAMSAEMIKSMR